jgi:CHAT domain-containing protein/Tfp pilus assembly protein PilF
MKLIVNSTLILGLNIMPSLATLSIAQVAITQPQSSQSEALRQLLRQAKQQAQQGKPQQAIETFQEALKLARQLKNRSLQATTLNNIGLVYSDIGQPQEALKYLQQALPIRREVGDRSGEVITLSNIGAVYRYIGQPQETLKYFQQALPIAREIGDRSGEATTLNSIGLVYRDIGQPQEALKYYQQALPIRREIKDGSGEATILNSIGLVHRDIGQLQEALKYLQQALTIRREVVDRSGEAITLSNIGGVYRDIGQPQEALKYLQQALPIRREIKDRSGEATTLNSIGGVYGYIGQPQEALKYLQQALPIRREIKDRSGEATTLNSIGGVYRDIGQPQEALKYLQQALPIRREIKDRSGEAITLNSIGAVYSDIGQPQEALKYYQQALPIRREIKDRSGEAISLNNIGAVYGDIGQTQEALKYLQQALTIAREIENRSGKATVLSNIGAVYRDIGQPQEAIRYLEESAQLTLELRRGLVRENRTFFVDANSGDAVGLISLLIDTKQTKLAYEWSNLATTFDLADYTRLLNAKVANPQAQKALNGWSQQKQQLQQLYQQLKDKFSDKLARQVRDQEEKVNQQAESISRQFPEVAELLETTPQNIAQLQASIPASTTVIHMVLLTGFRHVPNTLALFVLTKDSLIVKKVSVESKQLDTLLTQTYGQLINRHDTDYLKNLADLYDLLIRPVKKEIQATTPKRLSIIATGKLRYLPFEALYDSQANQYLLQQYPISYLTRLSVHSLQPLQAGNPIAAPIRKILALGDPMPQGYQALPGAEQEIKLIVPIFPGSKSLLGSEATLNSFKLQSLQFSLVHLATHGCFHKGGCKTLGLEENTLLFADQRLNIADAALLGLQNINLITLSACETALETNSKGEEVAGLAYLFERAGAKAVIASLWSAADQTTQEIMVQFYVNLKHGMNKSEALQKAKLSQIDSYPHPFFWAPFVLIGDPL